MTIQHQGVIEYGISHCPVMLIMTRSNMKRDSVAGPLTWRRARRGSRSTRAHEASSASQVASLNHERINDAPPSESSSNPSPPAPATHFLLSILDLTWECILFQESVCRWIYATINGCFNNFCISAWTHSSMDGCRNRTCPFSARHAGLDELSLDLTHQIAGSHKHSHRTPRAALLSPNRTVPV